MTAQYIHLTYEDYKSLEQQMRAFAETSHRSEGGFYHKSIRLKIDGSLLMEFHGPLVGGYGHGTERDRGALAEVARLTAEVERLRGIYRHTHGATYDDGVLIDKCRYCGLDLRDSIHERLASAPATGAEEKTT